MNSTTTIDTARQQDDSTRIDAAMLSERDEQRLDELHEAALLDPLTAIEELGESVEDATHDAMLVALGSTMRFGGIHVHRYPTAAMIGASIVRWRDELAERYARTELQRERAEGGR